MPNITIKTKVQAITYETSDGSLGKTFATSEKRISLSEARDILKERGTDFKEVLKVKYEIVYLLMPLENYESYLNQYQN